MTFLHALRRLSIVEGISTLVLFGIAMPLKYFADMPMAVRIAGSIHGALFVALVLMLVIAVRKVPLSPALAVAGMVAAVLPGGPFLFDRRLARYDR
jgi:integral membrane protein